MKAYFNYIQKALGAKSILLPQKVQEDLAETTYHFAVEILGQEAREILANIIKALKARKYSVLELKIERSTESEIPSPNLEGNLDSNAKTKSVLIIFGREAAQFFLPNTLIEMGQAFLISGSQTLLTHSIEAMRERPELKREAWQHLKAFVNK